LSILESSESIGDVARRGLTLSASTERRCVSVSTKPEHPTRHLIEQIPQTRSISARQARHDITTTSSGEFGDILTDSNGTTLYIFDRDTEGVSNCSGGCLNAWPPLIVDETPTAGSGVTADIATITRGDGSVQVTVNDMPIYYWANDAAAGDAGGGGTHLALFGGC